MFFSYIDIPVDNFGTVVGENQDCVLLSGTVVGENLDHVCWDGNVRTMYSPQQCWVMQYSEFKMTLFLVPP